MPTYTVFAASDRFTDEQRIALAGRITEIHAERTGAPKSFVQTVFLDLGPGRNYVGGAPADPRQIWVHGHIRDGRSTDVRTALALGIRDAFEQVTTTPRAYIWVYLSQLSHTDMIEFGEVLPAPGGEAAWIAAMPAGIRNRLTELG